MGMLWSWEVLSTRSITGKFSNAYKLNNDAKPQLDQEKVKDIYVVSIFQYIKSHFIWFWQQVTLTVPLIKHTAIPALIAY